MSVYGRANGQPSPSMCANGAFCVYVCACEKEREELRGQKGFP